MYPIKITTPKPFLQTNKPERKNFKLSTRKREWNRAAGRTEDKFTKTSYCSNPRCKRKLT